MRVILVLLPNESKVSPFKWRPLRGVTINSTVSQEMTGSANDRFLNRSIRSLLPNSIDPNLNPKELIRKRILNHEHRIKNKNKNNKVIYDIGARVRLQEVKTKEFSILELSQNKGLPTVGSL